MVHAGWDVLGVQQWPRGAHTVHAAGHGVGQVVVVHLAIVRGTTHTAGKRRPPLGALVEVRPRLPVAAPAVAQDDQSASSTTPTQWRAQGELRTRRGHGTAHGRSENLRL